MIATAKAERSVEQLYLGACCEVSFAVVSLPGGSVGHLFAMNFAV